MSNEFMPEQPKSRSSVLPLIAMFISGFAFGYLYTSHIYEKRVKTWYDKAVNYSYSTLVYRAIAIKVSSKTNDPKDPEATEAVDNFATQILALLKRDANGEPITK